MEHLVRECFRSEGYVFARKAEEIAKERGLSRIARLASNEHPRPPSPRAIELGCRALERVNRYPDEKVRSLLDTLEKHYGDYHFVTGVGMDGVIETVIRTLVDPGDRVAISVPTFSFYRLAAVAQGAKVEEVPRNPDFSVHHEKFIRASKGSKLSFLCSPNNPTGTTTSTGEIADILERIDGVLFLDNAYVEFSGIDYLPLLKRYENLIIGRTMSKVYSLAGLRIGYAFVPGWLVPYYTRAATPFTLNTVSSETARGALQDRSHVEETVAHVAGWRERFVKECPFRITPSGANFVMVDVAPHTGDQAVELLAEKGVIVRSCRSFRGLPDHYIRVSIGEDWENELFLSAVRSL
jgi:histidinol-phosphate aminotransferase